jgi:sphingomyelin phosphodiesterase
MTTSANASVPASRFGSFDCDTPADLALSVFYNMDQFVNKSDIAFAIFTGDIVSHDNDNQISRAYVEYEEKIAFQTFKAQMNGKPVYATLGNHDSLPQGLATQNSIDNSSKGRPNEFSWNYDLIAEMWQSDGWISKTAAQQARTHYGAYATVTPHGLKIISINPNFWYTSIYADNLFNYWNMTNPDQSGMLAFLAGELQASDDIDQRVWIIGHVPSGYDGVSALPNPTSLFYSIVARFSPSTIAAIFFGHTHDDQMLIYYDFAVNSTIVDSSGSVLRNTSLVDY